MEYYSYCLGEAAGCLRTGKDVHVDAADEARRQGVVRMCDVCERWPAAVVCKTDAAALCHASDAASRHRRLPIIAPLVPIPVPTTTTTTNRHRHYMNSPDPDPAPASFTINGTSTTSTSTTSSPTTTTTSTTPTTSSTTITVPDHDRIRFYNYIPHLITSSSTSTTQNHYWPLGTHQYCFNNYYGAGAISHESVNLILPLMTDSWSSSSNHDQKQTHRNFQQSSDHHRVLMGQQQGRPKSLHQPSLITTTAPLQYYAHSTSTASDFPAAQGGSSGSSESIMKTIDRSRVEYFSGRLGNYPPIGTPTTTTTTTTTFMSMERRAKILKYREKRKKRNYGKTVRYVNRKADAETRPRIGGRFARIPDKTT